LTTAPGAAAAPAPAPPASGASPLTTTLADVLSGPAKEDYLAGRLLYGDHDYAGALVKFQSAYDRSKEPRLFFDLAACEKNLRHYARTIADFERYRAEGGASLTDADRSEVDRYLAELRPFVGTVQVTANQDGATVFVDEEAVGSTPLAAPLQLDIGSRQIRISKNGFKDWSAAISVRGVETMTVEGRLDPIVHEGRLLVRAGDHDAIDIDGQPVGTGRFDGPLPSGGHQLRVQGDGMSPFQSEVLIQDDQTRTIEVTLQHASHAVPLWAWIAGGAVVVAGATVGGYFLFKPKDEVGPPTLGSINPGTVTLSFGRRP
jgi:hypothetical protein